IIVWNRGSNKLFGFSRWRYVSIGFIQVHTTIYYILIIYIYIYREKSHVISFIEAYYFIFNKGTIVLHFSSKFFFWGGGGGGG
ncbi:hypothetical protein ACJX0J_033032, partial [Zea mays]